MLIDHGLAAGTPIETIIDCLQLKRFDYRRDDWPGIASSSVRLRALMPDGSFVEEMACSLPWRDLVAYGAREGEMAQCDSCCDFEPVSEMIDLGGETWCMACYENADWDED